MIYGFGSSNAYISLSFLNYARNKSRLNQKSVGVDGEDMGRYGGNIKY
jgi:hypothetical protein